MTANNGSTVQRIAMRIDGKDIVSESGRTYTSFNPFTGDGWAEVADGSEADVNAAVGAARKALGGEWAQYSAPARGRLLARLAQLIERDADILAELETRDSGKLLREMGGQVRSLRAWFTYFAGMADKVQGDVIPTDKANFLVYTRHEPVGVVAAITPWNSPLLLLTWKLAPALAAGCTIVVKPSEYTPASTVALARLVEEAGFAPGVVNVVTGQGPETGKALVAHPGIDKIAFTGSTETGRAVAAGAASTLARLTLELGGKSAQLVFEDADISAAADGVVAGVFAATGQTCMAGSRLVVHQSVADELVAAVVSRAQEIVLGDPRSPDTEMGPLANVAQYTKVLSHFDQARREGATVRCGGSTVAELGGFFVQPTVLTDLPPSATALHEEIFGPVLAVVTFDSEDEAIEIANSTEFGLAASVWTTDVRRAHRVASRVRAGSVWINAYRMVAPQVPFGGFGASGVGRENGIGAIKEYLETKAVWVELAGESRDPFTLG